MRGYPVPSGYMGWYKGKWRLFATEQEYKELYMEESYGK